MNHRRFACLSTLALAAALSLAAATAVAKEYKLRTSHYTIRTDVGAAFAKELATVMEAIYKNYRGRLKTLGRNRKGRHSVLVFEDRDAYVGFVGAQHANSGGIYMPSEKTLATYQSGQSYARMIETLKHEGFHQFLHSYVKYPVPLWVNEGLAQVFESAIRKDSGGFVSGDAPRWRVAHIRKAVKDGDVFDLKKLFSLTHEQWGANMANRRRSMLQYNQSWSVVHFLAYAKNAKYRKRLMAYLRLFDKKTDFDTAFRKVFGRDIKSFNKAWRRYVTDELRASNRAVDIDHMRSLCLLLGTLAKKDKTLETIEQLYEIVSRGEVRLVIRGKSPDAKAEDMFTSPGDPRVKDAGDKKPDKPILSYIVEPPLGRADPAWPTLRCTHHKRFDLIARHRRIGKGKDAPIILEVLQTRKKIIRKPR